MSDSVIMSARYAGTVGQLDRYHVTSDLGLVVSLSPTFLLIAKASALVAHAREYLHSMEAVRA